jgi:tetratricopeptide (TPR) repeat protein
MMQRGDYQSAIPVLEAELAKNPASTKARSRLGFAYLKSGKLDMAIAEFNKVLEIEPGEPYSVLYLGLAYLYKNDRGKAIATWQGYRNAKMPLVEEEIRRQLTILQIAESQAMAKRAVAEEKKLMAKKGDPSTIAVCYYDDLSPDKSLRAFQKGLTAMIITDLSKIKSLKVVERVRLQALLQEMKLGQTGIVDKRTAPKVGKLLGAGQIVVGNLAKGSISAVTVVTGAKKGTIETTVEDNQFFDLSIIIVREITKVMKVTVTPAEAKAVSVPHTKNFKAFVTFGEGLIAFDEGKWQKAKSLFSKAFEMDESFQLALDMSSACPGPDSPGIGAVGSVSAQDVDQAVTAAVAAQSEADAASSSVGVSAAPSGDGGGGGGGGGGCFAYDTKVLMADKSHKRIIDLREGDLVLTQDIHTGVPVIRDVTALYRADQNHYYLLNNSLKVTATHPFYNNKGEWVEASDLAVGDLIRSTEGMVRVSSIQKLNYDHRTYNFRVRDSHNYFVSATGKEYYLVHN